MADSPFVCQIAVEFYFGRGEVLAGEFLELGDLGGVVLEEDGSPLTLDPSPAGGEGKLVEKFAIIFQAVGSGDEGVFRFMFQVGIGAVLGRSEVGEIGEDQRRL